METGSLTQRAFAAFKNDASVPPPLPLRGANAVDSYDLAEPYDPALDEPTDAYLEGFAFWGIPHLDGRSWRHYLPRLIEYTLAHPDDPAMVAEALVRSLRPPDRYPPRLRSLTPGQEDVVREFLELLAGAGGARGVEGEAQQALEEWWLPNPRSRPSAEAIVELRAEPMHYRAVGEGGYRLTLPDKLTGSEPRDIPSESRRVQMWGGYLCWDVHTIVAVNMTPASVRPFDEVIDYRKKLLEPPVAQVAAQVPGARRAVRFDGFTPGSSPAEPRTLSMLIADAGLEIATLTVTSWPREDASREVDRIIRSFAIVTA